MIKRGLKYLNGAKVAVARPFHQACEASLAQLAGNKRAAMLGHSKAAAGFAKLGMHLYQLCSERRSNLEPNAAQECSTIDTQLLDRGVLNPAAMMRALVP